MKQRLRRRDSLLFPPPSERGGGYARGDKVDFYLDEDSDTVQIVPRNGKLAELAGFIKRVQPEAVPASQADIDKAIAEQVFAEHERVSREADDMFDFGWQREHC